MHVCEATLTKRLIEFENTDSGSLTVWILSPGNCQIHRRCYLPHTDENLLQRCICNKDGNDSAKLIVGTTFPSESHS